MKVKKIILSALASVMALSSLVCLNSSAVYIAASQGSEHYNTWVESYNAHYTPAPELADVFSNVFPKYNVKNVWIKYTDPQLSVYQIEFSHDDYILMYFKPVSESYEDIIGELESELTYDEINTIGGSMTDNYFSVYITFNGESHERNIMIAEKAYSFLKDKYETKDIRTGFAEREFKEIKMSSGFDAIDGVIVYESKADFNESMRNIVDSESEWLKENYQATFDESRMIQFPEGITDMEKLECFRYFVEKYNVSVHYTYLASSSSASAIDVDFEPENISYLAGDANADGELIVADATLILQSVGNSDKYKLTEQGEFNADIFGNCDGVSALDAFEIQKILATR